ncbi:MAG: hypothetical protein HOO06_04650 [Bdellovibrionaceae bacterium]|jgi:hypothetical protein|nr:hypothetical protein [Pseudobdellovibrionaceae bacterium]
MNHNFPWAKAFNIPISEVKNTASQYSSHSEVLKAYMQNQRVSPSAYMNWARNYFSLASLNADFFQTMSNPHVYLKKINDAHWNPYFLPVFEDEGVLFIACLEPNFQISLGQPYQFFLASITDLENYWSRLQALATPASTATHIDPLNENQNVASTSQQTNFTHEPVDELQPIEELAPLAQPQHLEELKPKPAPIKPNSASEHTSPQSADHPATSLDDLASSFAEIAPTPNLQTVNSDIPEGINLNIQTEASTLESPEDIFYQAEKQAVDTPEPVLEMPDGFGGASAATQSQAVLTDVPEGMGNLSAVTPQSDELSFPEPQAAPEPIQNTLEEEFSSQAAEFSLEPPASVTAQTMESQLSSTNHTHDEDEPQDFELTMVGTALPEIKDQSFKEDEQIDTPINNSNSVGASDDTGMVPDVNFQSVGENNTKDEIMSFHFGRLKQNYENFILLSHLNGELKAWKWNQEVKPLTDVATNPIDLKTPSLFTIVLNTRKPYHGYVVDGDTNTSFFKSWGYEALPPLITAVPIIHNQEVTSILLCISAKNDLGQAELRDVCRQTDKLSEDLAKAQLKVA